MDGILEFRDRVAFRAWLEKNGAGSDGVWLLFGKKGGPATLTAAQALEEALCFGWIDGQMQSIDDKTYRKYFSARRANSKWSEKNKTLAEKLEQHGIMTNAGRSKIEEAKRNGQWSAQKPQAITEEHITFLSALLEKYEPAHSHFLKMSPSVKRPMHEHTMMPKRMMAAPSAYHGWSIG